MKGIIKWAKPYKGLLLLVLFFTVINPLTYSFVPQFIRYIVNVILGGGELAEGDITLPAFLLEFYQTFENPLTAIVIVGATLAIFQLLRGIIMFLNGYVKGKLGESISYDMRIQLYSHIQNLSYSKQNEIETGDTIQRCTSDVETVRSFITAQLPELLYIIFSFASGAIQMALIDYRIMLITLCVIPLTLTASFIYYRYVSKKFEEIEEVEADMTTVLQENVNGVRVVKAFNNEIFEIEKFNNKSQKYRDESKKLNNMMGFYWGTSDFLTFLQYGLTVTACIILAKNKAVDTGDIIACMMYIGMLVWPIRSLGRIIGDFGKSVVSAKRIDEILDMPSEYEINGTKKPSIKGNIEFKNVSFKFDDTNEHLLNNINFNIKAGETIAIVGKTGSGKSTIANILVRMLEYDQGEVLIDGINLKEIDKKWIRENVGIVLQDPFLYAKSIKENIRIASSRATEEKVYDVAKVAAIHEDIMSFALGYDTLVGEKGVTLSGGQKQRIAIARMLILNRPIMIFDDSLSAVDTKTDLMIRNRLKTNSQSLTSIIITHRITTAKEADRIIVLENGTVSAIGTHQQLANQEGLYKQLWDIQGALEDQFVTYVEGGETDE